MAKEHQDNHGSTPAAWTAVTIVMIAFCVGGLGVLISQAWLFWVGIAMIALGAATGKVMQMMGMGAKPAS